MSLLSATFLLFLVMDPIGNIPMFLSTLRKVKPERRKKIILRELVIALIILVAFMFGGHGLLHALQIQEPSLSISGGIILFIIALKMIFPVPEGIFGLSNAETDEPLIVPLAIPLLAGPSTLSTILVMNTREPSRWLEWLMALFIAWLVTGIILFSSNILSHYLNKRVLIALERLMGMLLTTIAIQMFLQGIKEFMALT